jgi:hypothetical protein
LTAPFKGVTDVAVGEGVAVPTGVPGGHRRGGDGAVAELEGLRHPARTVQVEDERHLPLILHANAGPVSVYEIVFEPHALDAAARFLKEDPNGLALVLDTIGKLADDPRPAASAPYGSPPEDQG